MTIPASGSCSIHRGTRRYLPVTVLNHDLKKNGSTKARNYEKFEIKNSGIIGAAIINFNDWRYVWFKHEPCNGDAVTSVNTSATF